jgi:hypothetical protein
MPGIEAYGRADWPIIAVQNSVLGLQPCPVRPLKYCELIRFETDVLRCSTPRKC